MKLVSVLLLLIGLVLCPGYLIYAVGFSGEQVDALQFVDQDINSVSIGGFRASSSGEDRSSNENSIQLSPEMNPIRLIAKAKYSANPAISFTQHSAFELSMYHGADLLWTEPFKVSESAPDSGEKRSANHITNSSQPVKLVSVDQAAEYKLRLKRLREQDVRISNLSIEVRRNVSEVKASIWGTGSALMLVGILGLVVSRRKP